MCAIDDSEPFKFTNGEVKRKARTEHTCDECWRKIKAGEIYTYLTGISGYNSKWESYRTCQHCVAAGLWIQVACGGYPLTMLRDELTEHRREYPESTTLRGLLDSVENRWSNGSDNVPNLDAIIADAKRCIGQLVIS
jgi:hypothetical protein